MREPSADPPGSADSLSLTGTGSGPPAPIGTVLGDVMAKIQRAKQAANGEVHDPEPELTPEQVRHELDAGKPLSDEAMEAERQRQLAIIAAERVAGRL